MKILALGLIVALLSGCSVKEDRPAPSDIKEFVADPIPVEPGFDYWKDFKVTQSDLEKVLTDYSPVDENHWYHNYSHVGYGDRTGQIVLKDGRHITWMVKPGGLAWLEFSSGKKMYFALHGN